MLEPSQSSTGTVSVELFGMPRVVAGTARVPVSGETLRDVLRNLVECCPDLTNHVLSADGEWLNTGYTFVVDGAFVSNPELPVRSSSEILLVSRASGG